jgi:hypothetical protein
MRTLILNLFIVLYCFEVAGRDRVTVENPIVSLAATAQELRELCGTEGDYDACTRFVAFRLQASCFSTDTGWRATASATFRPFILLRNMRSLSHEQLHIGDLRRSVETLLIFLEETPFASEASCRSSVSAESAAFGSSMRQFALESNEARHPSLRRPSSAVAASRGRR